MSEIQNSDSKNIKTPFEHIIILSALSVFISVPAGMFGEIKISPGTNKILAFIIFYIFLLSLYFSFYFFRKKNNKSCFFSIIILIVFSIIFYNKIIKYNLSEQPSTETVTNSIPTQPIIFGEDTSQHPEKTSSVGGNINDEDIIKTNRYDENFAEYTSQHSENINPVGGNINPDDIIPPNRYDENFARENRSH
ncbi:hypothetical protein LJC41_01305 [Desulfosarcina sp. OttesenSCG-928-G17]|nr:hypothetical protein [Desulfosarcina sp. OttesenSCG-928-G17]